MCRSSGREQDTGFTFAVFLPFSSTRTCGRHCCRATKRWSGLLGGRSSAQTSLQSDPSAQISRSLLALPEKESFITLIYHCLLWHNFLTQQRIFYPCSTGVR